jgi:hypothetical protein
MECRSNRTDMLFCENTSLTYYHIKIKATGRNESHFKKITNICRKATTPRRHIDELGN